MAEIVFLRPDDPPDAFPDPAMAATEPDGLLAVGGDLTPERLLAAYRHGIFPWYETGQPILWWSPDPRAVLIPSRLHVSRSLRRTLRSDRYRVSIDQAFESVIDGCANSRATSGTWITPEMRSAYLNLHELGYAHAVETWDGPELVGGLYGIALGGVFFGESMFSYATDASKVALVKLVRVVESRGFELIDCQVATRHLNSLGSELMPRADFVRVVRNLAPGTVNNGTWHEAPGRSSQLVPPPQKPARLHD
ncbi:MAG: leucyl/phenylalanyl-tRNA--protein transferase [Chromatiales bacterium]|nr:MAG: leucyl/phenylalanyl-tRNA--protein transferase [Chromatiales bacterium]